MTSFAVNFDVEFGVGQHPTAKGLQLGEARIIGWVVKVLGELIHPDVKRLAQSSTMLFTHLLPDSKAGSGRSRRHPYLAPLQ